MEGYNEFALHAETKQGVVVPQENLDKLSRGAARGKKENRVQLSPKGADNEAITGFAASEEAQSEPK